MEPPVEPKTAAFADDALITTGTSHPPVVAFITQRVILSMGEVHVAPDATFSTAPTFRAVTFVSETANSTEVAMPL